MTSYDYKVIPAPRHAKKVRGAKTVPDRFAHALTDAINTQAGDGWEYVRAETLPVDEKKGMLSSASEVYHSVLVFRRATSSMQSAQSRPRLAAVDSDERPEPTLTETRLKPTIGPIDYKD